MLPSLTGFRVLVLALLFPVAGARGAEEPEVYPDRLAGDWQGLRSWLDNRGLLLEARYTLEGWRNFSGGAGQGGRILGNLDLGATLDGEAALGLPGTRAFVYVLGNHGGRPNDLAGSHGGISNIEAGVPAFKLYEAWVEQEFLGSRVSLLAGLFDLNSEFYATETSGLFLNPSYGIGTEMAASGDNGPSIFPTTSLAARIAFRPTAGSYLQAAAFDAVSGDPANGRGTHVRIKRGEGALLVAEGGVRSETLGHLAVGAWRYTARRPSWLPSLPARSQGIYFLADREIAQPGGREWHVFARLGFAADDVDPFRSSWSAGAVWTGLLALRPLGRLGFGVSQIENGDAFMAASAASERRETQLELTWEDQVARGVSIQPDLQYTVYPGTAPGVSAAWTAGMRLTVDF